MRMVVEIGIRSRMIIGMFRHMFGERSSGVRARGNMIFSIY